MPLINSGRSSKALRLADKLEMITNDQTEAIDLS